ncbi:MAG: folylpolyglutamate synthase/dihydrofolate synthase family protein [Candidatus Margulisiibacteriota bacterium]
MTYDQVLEALSTQVQSKGIRYDLEPFKQALKALGNPHRLGGIVLHIAGTNGKGSTTAFLAAALQAVGLNVGTYTSPHLIDYTERIRLNGTPISQADFVHHHSQVASKAQTLTEFETLTAMAFGYFRDQKPDVVILETGLGGRLDATNVVHPTLSVITRIGWDHQAILGNRIQDIAREKAGIIKPKIPVVALRQHPAALGVIQAQATHLQAPFILAKPLASLPAHYALNASYQRDNAGVATAVLDTLFQLKKLSTTQLQTAKTGLALAKNPGRFTVIQTPTQTLVIDAAHNPSGISALQKALQDRFPTQTPTFLVGILKTKNANQMLNQLAPHPVYYCTFSPDAHTYASLKKAHPTLQTWSLTDSLPKAPLLVISGSIYFLGLLVSAGFSQQDWV